MKEVKHLKSIDKGIYNITLTDYTDLNFKDTRYSVGILNDETGESESKGFMTYEEAEKFFYDMLEEL